MLSSGARQPSVLADEEAYAPGCRPADGLHPAGWLGSGSKGKVEEIVGWVTIRARLQACVNLGRCPTVRWGEGQYGPIVDGQYVRGCKNQVLVRYRPAINSRGIVHDSVIALKPSSLSAK